MSQRNNFQPGFIRLALEDKTAASRVAFRKPNEFVWESNICLLKHKIRNQLLKITDRILLHLNTR